MRIAHRGIRPVGKIHWSTNGKMGYGNHQLTQYEILEDGSKKYWTKRMLTSGCNKIFSIVVKLEDLIYCDHCKEYFSADQFAEIGERDEVHNPER